jgi:hypothetical protein
MPTVPRRPAAQRERDRLQARRLRAAELFAAGVDQIAALAAGYGLEFGEPDWLPDVIARYQLNPPLTP